MPTKDQLEKAMQALKKKCQRDGLFKYMKQKRYYTKPSEIRRNQKLEGIKRFKKIEAEKKKYNHKSKTKSNQRLVRMERDKIFQF